MPKLQTVIESAKRFAVRLGDATSSSGPHTFERPFVIFSNDELGDLQLTGQEAREFTDLEIQLHELTRDRISERGASVALQQAILKTLDVTKRADSTPLPARAKSAFKELEQRLTSPPADWATLIPMYGITVPKRPWRIGNVTITRITTKVCKALLDKIERVITSGTDADEMKQRTRDEIKRELFDPHEGQPFAVVRTRSIDAGAAWSSAKRQLRFTVDCLNFVVGIVHSHSIYYAITDVGRAHADRAGLIVADDASDSSTHYERETMSLNAQEFRREIQKEAGLRRLVRYLAAERPTGHQERVLSAMQWAGRGAVARRPEEAFLYCAIALESLMLGRKDVELTTRLALSVAIRRHILVHTIHRHVMRLIRPILRGSLRALGSGSFSLR